MVKVSVIVPVYKVEKYLDVCLDSILNQTFEDFEVICINDGSPDSCIDILRQYSLLDKRIKVYSQKNQGLSAARNLGMKYAGGEFITFVDSDDFLSPVALERMYQNITENKSDYMFSYVYQVFPERLLFWELPNIKEFKKAIQKPVFNENDLDAEFYLKFIFSAWAKMYRREFIKNFSFPEGLIFEDLPFFASCYLNAKKYLMILNHCTFTERIPILLLEMQEKTLLIFLKLMKLLTRYLRSAASLTNTKRFFLSTRWKVYL